MYTLKNKKEFKKIVDKLNSQLGFEWYKVYDITYPHLFVVGTEEMYARTNDATN